MYLYSTDEFHLCRTPKHLPSARTRTAGMNGNEKSFFFCHVVFLTCFAIHQSIFIKWHGFFGLHVCAFHRIIANRLDLVRYKMSSGVQLTPVFFSSPPFITLILLALYVCELLVLYHVVRCNVHILISKLVYRCHGLCHCLTPTKNGASFGNCGVVSVWQK